MVAVAAFLCIYIYTHAYIGSKRDNSLGTLRGRTDCAPCALGCFCCCCCYGFPMRIDCVMVYIIKRCFGTCGSFCMYEERKRESESSHYERGNIYKEQRNWLLWDMYFNASVWLCIYTQRILDYGERLRQRRLTDIKCGWLTSGYIAYTYILGI